MTLHESVSTDILRENNFDLLRFSFAFVVFLVHAYALSGVDALLIFSQVLSSEIAVKSFFVVSGFLIFMSYEKSHGLRNYFTKRVRRIYPAYFLVIIACALLGSAFSTYPLQDYFSLSFLKYLLFNLLFLGFLQPNLLGLFEHNTLQAVNGALWTLKIEVMFYLFVPLAVLALRKFGKAPVLLGLYICSVIYAVSMEALAHKTGSGFYLELQRQLPGQLANFIAGAAGYYYLDKLIGSGKWLVVLAALSFLLQAYLPWMVIQPAALAIMVVYFACGIPSLGNFDKYGDFSYGIYIVHFPILQLMIAYGWFNRQPWTALGITTLMVLLAAFLLWHFVEKPFLRKSSHYVASNHG